MTAASYGAVRRNSACRFGHKLAAGRHAGPCQSAQLADHLRHAGPGQAKGPHEAGQSSQLHPPGPVAERLAAEATESVKPNRGHHKPGPCGLATIARAGRVSRTHTRTTPLAAKPPPPTGTARG